MFLVSSTKALNKSYLERSKMIGFKSLASQLVRVQSHKEHICVKPKLRSVMVLECTQPDLSSLTYGHVYIRPPKIAL